MIPHCSSAPSSVPSGRIDPDQAIGAISTVAELLAQWEANRRFTTLLLGVFTALAVALAATVCSRKPAPRKREIV
jgi:hypothetical protein